MKTLVYFSVVIAVLAGACAPFPNGSTSAVFAQSDLEREQEPQVDSALIEVLVAGNTEFAFHFYNQINEQQGNLVFSPLSLSLALGMATAGAKADTRTEMLEALSLQALGEEMHPAFNVLLHAIEDSQMQLEDQSRGDSFQLNIANSSWGQSGFAIDPAFLDTLALHYGAGMYSVDFVQDSEGSRQAINQWVDEETSGKIPDLIPAGAIDALTRLVLANAIYFKGSWLYEFDRTATLTAPFFLVDGSKQSVEMMQLKGERLGYARGEDFQLLRLPYLSSDFSMLLLVPDAGAFAVVEKRLTAESFSASLAEMSNLQVDLSMPKFDFETAISAPSVLKDLGMLSAFDPGLADFSGINSEQDLYITDVLHKATISVDEQGTEAAAATAVIMGLTSMPMDEPIQLVIDRPFIFAIQHQPSGTILFLGRVLEP